MLIRNCAKIKLVNSYIFAMSDKTQKYSLKTYNFKAYKYKFQVYLIYPREKRGFTVINYKFHAMTLKRVNLEHEIVYQQKNIHKKLICLRLFFHVCVLLFICLLWMVSQIWKKPTTKRALGLTTLPCFNTTERCRITTSKLQDSFDICQRRMKAWDCAVCRGWTLPFKILPHLPHPWKNKRTRVVIWTCLFSHRAYFWWCRSRNDNSEINVCGMERVKLTPPTAETTNGFVKKISLLRLLRSVNLRPLNEKKKPTMCSPLRLA